MDPVSDGDDLSGLGTNGDSSGGTSSQAHVNGAAQHGGNGSGNGSVNGVLTTLEGRLPATPALNWAYGPPAKPEILSAKPSPMELSHAVRRRWGLALGLGLMVGTAAAALVWYFLPIKYEAFALLKVSNRPPTVLNETPSGVEEFNIFKRTQVQLLLSPLVLQRTVSEPEINRLQTMRDHDDDPASWLKDQLILDYPDDSEILRVAMTGTSSGDIRKIVDKVVDKYMAEIVQREREVRIAQEEKLDRSLRNRIAEYNTQQDVLHKMEKTEKTPNSEVARLDKTLATEHLHDLLGQRARLISQVTENDMKIALLETREERPDDFQTPQYMIEMELNKDDEIKRMTLQLSALREAWTDRKELSRHPEKDKQLPVLKKKVLKLEEELEEKKAMLRPQIAQMFKDAGAAAGSRSGPVDSLETCRAKRQLLEDKVTKVTDDIEEQRLRIQEMEIFSSRVVGKQQELRAMDRITTDLQNKLDRLKVEKDAPERIQKMDVATLKSGSGNSIQKYVAVVFSGILGFGIVVVTVAFLEFQKRKINAVHEVNDGLGIRVIGELPNVSGRVWRRLKGGQGPTLLKALMAERIDGTRTALIHTTVIDPPRVVMITSAEPHEGKTTTASQLAASLARSGRRTLLVDADIRNPGAHRVFDMPQEPGLCELLRGEAERDAVIHPTRTANLWLMPAGRCDLRSVQALSTSYLGTAIAALCVQFDYVIIDSGPVLKVADPLLVGQHCDAAIVSVLKDVSKVPKVYEACERLRSVGITVLGSVVNGVNDDAARHGVELLMAETTHAAEKAAT